MNNNLNLCLVDMLDHKCTVILKAYVIVAMLLILLETQHSLHVIVLISINFKVSFIKISTNSMFPCYVHKRAQRTPISSYLELIVDN